MNRKPNFGAIGIVLVVLAALALTAGSASAGPIINFEELPNDGGIHLGGFDNDGNVIDVTIDPCVANCTIQNLRPAQSKKELSSL